MKNNPTHGVKLLFAAACAGLLFAFLAGCQNPSDLQKQGGRGKNPPVEIPSSEKKLIEFKFEAAKNGLTEDVNGVIDEFLKTVSLVVPKDTDIKKLKASFTVSEKAQVFIKNNKKVDIEQISGTTENDFTPFVLYTIKAEDGSSQVYRVQVDAPSASGMFKGKSIAAFSFSKDLNPSLNEDITSFVTYSKKTDQRFIYLKFPAGTAEETVKNLKPVFTASAKARISVKNKAGTYDELKSGETAADFYTPGTKTIIDKKTQQTVPRYGTDIKITAENGESTEYSVQVEIDLPKASKAEVEKYFGSYRGTIPGLGAVIIVLEENKVTLYSQSMSMDYVNIEWEKKDDGSYTCTTYKKNMAQIKNANGKGGYDFAEKDGKITVKTYIMGVPTTAEKGESFVWKSGCGYAEVSMHI